MKIIAIELFLKRFLAGFFDFRVAVKREQGLRQIHIDDGVIVIEAQPFAAGDTIAPRSFSIKATINDRM